MPLLHCLLIYYTCDVNICVEMDPGTHMVCVRFYPLEPDVEVFHACNTDFVLSCKNKKVVARKLGAKCKGDKTYIWVPKDVVTNLVGPNKSWVPKTQA
jgi:hypothetical protein